MTRPGVGLGVFIWKDDKFLMGKRVGKHGENTWSVPGGWLEYGESFEECAAREAKEETGVNITNIRQFTTVNNIFADENQHSITIFMNSDWESGDPKDIELDKFIEIGWFDFTNMPSPLFLPLVQLKKAKPELFASS
jgi:8-oxo-dGTP diphosphatase